MILCNEHEQIACVMFLMGSAILGSAVVGSANMGSASMAANDRYFSKVSILT